MVEELFEFPKTSGKMMSTNVRFLEQGQIAHVRDDIGLQRLTNVSDQERAVTLHLYVKPLEKVKEFGEFIGEMTERVLEYDSVCRQQLWDI